MTTPEQQFPEGKNAEGVPEVNPYCIFMGKPLYNRKAAQILLGCSERTLRRYVMLGKLRSVSLGEDMMNVAFFEEHLRDFLTRKDAKKKASKRRPGARQ
jgi:hypothetical protein